MGAGYVRTIRVGFSPSKVSLKVGKNISVKEVGLFKGRKNSISPLSVTFLLIIIVIAPMRCSPVKVWHRERVRARPLT